ncbi:uncharacterized protein [Palaemon carinicauda]|uniref:uncharacterized protein n=1 Tax=Palaemon carinicauda TaxID=392227 RepID=UPI0035B64CC7
MLRLSASTIVECGICAEKFKEAYVIPLILPCSHSFCASCLEELIRRNEKCCPICRKHFEAQSTNDLIINRHLLDMIHYFDAVGLKPGKLKAGNSFVASQRQMCHEFKEKNLADSRSVQNKIEELLQINDQFEGMVRRANEQLRTVIQAKLNEIWQKHLNIIDCIRESSARLKKSLSVIVECQKEMETVLNFSASTPIGDNVDETVYNLQQSLSDAQMCIRKRDIAYMSIKKEFDVTQHTLIVIEDVLAAAWKDEDEEEEAEEPNYASNIDQGMASRAVRILSLTLGSLPGKTGDLYAYHELNGKTRYAKVTKSAGVVGDNGFFVHHLKEEENLSANSHLVKFEDVMTPGGCFTGWAFFDLKYKKLSLGRIIIGLLGFPRTYDKKNFFMLCTGERGPSYANSDLLRVEKKGKEGERIVFGDYEKKGGLGGMPVVEEDSWWRSALFESVERPGTVFRDAGAQATASQFSIFTGPCEHLGAKLGYVVEGFGILKDIVAKYKVKKVKVEDCGIVLFT